MREHVSDFTLSFGGDHQPVFHDEVQDIGWEVTFAETGLLTGTGGRIARVMKYINTDVFAMTYGDGIGDVNLSAVLQQHRRAGRLATVTGVHPTSRFGDLLVDETGTAVVEFNEKPQLVAGWVSGGFFLLQREFADRYLTEDPDLFLEAEPLRRAAREGALGIYQHDGFWAGMDTFRDWTELNRRWDQGDAPWKVWKD